MKQAKDVAEDVANIIRVCGTHPDEPDVAVVEAWRIRAIVEATSRRIEGNADNPHELGAALAGALQGLKAALRSPVAIELSRRLGEENRRYAEHGY